MITNVALNLRSAPHIIIIIIIMYRPRINPTAITPLKSINTHNIYTLYIMIHILYGIYYVCTVTVLLGNLYVYKCTQYTHNITYIATTDRSN